METMNKVLAVVSSKTDESKKYEIRRGKDQTVYCTCPAWRFQRVSTSSRTCKHLKSFFAGQLASKHPVMAKSEAGTLLRDANQRAERAAQADRDFRQANKEEAARLQVAATIEAHVEQVVSSAPISMTRSEAAKASWARFKAEQAAKSAQ